MDEGGNMFEGVTPEDLIREQSADVEYPRSSRNVASGQGGGDFVIEIEDQQDLGCREAMQGRYEDDSKAKVKRNALFQPRIGGSKCRQSLCKLVSAGGRAGPDLGV